MVRTKREKMRDEGERKAVRDNEGGTVEDTFIERKWIFIPFSFLGSLSRMQPLYFISLNHFFFFCAFSHLSISLPLTFTVWFCLPRFASLPVSFSVFFISSHQFGLVAGRLTDLQVLLISCLEREKHGTGCLVVSTLLNSCRRA